MLGWMPENLPAESQHIEDTSGRGGMDTKTQITIRTKKLGVLIRDARLSARRSVHECAKAIGVRTGVFRSYEEGVGSPSLPELEALVYYLELPLEHRVHPNR